MNNAKVGIRKWLSFIVAGFVGQIAWAIENNCLNLYVFHTSPEQAVKLFIPLMTALSAVTATITTLFMGALSDRLGKRKIFISLGYIIWGISIILFAFLDPTNKVTFIANNSAFIAGTMIVITDCIMTFFGSTAMMQHLMLMLPIIQIQIIEVKLKRYYPFFLCLPLLLRLY